MSPEDNLLLLQEIEANRRFLLAAYRQNPALLARAEPRIKELLQPMPPEEPASPSAKPASDLDAPRI